MTGLLVGVIVLIGVLGYTVTLLAYRIAHLEASVTERLRIYEAHHPNQWDTPLTIETAVAHVMENG